MVWIRSDQRRRYLIIARVGDHSLHPQWLQPAEARNFDLLLNYYGDQPNLYLEDADYYWRSKGTKWPQLKEVVAMLGDVVNSYEAIWFPDDDLSANAVTINRMFEMFIGHNLQLAQPALLNNAFYPVTVQHIDYQLRYTNFVEVMAPIFNPQSLAICWPTFNANRTGWYLEFVWPKLLRYPDRRIAILDDAAVLHTRPPGSGELYRNIKDQVGNEDWVDQERGILKIYGIPEHETYWIRIGFYDGIKRWAPSGKAGIEPSQDHKRSSSKAKSRRKPSEQIAKRRKRRHKLGRLRRMLIRRSNPLRSKRKAASGTKRMAAARTKLRNKARSQSIGKPRTKHRAKPSGKNATKNIRPIAKRMGSKPKLLKKLRLRPRLRPRGHTAHSPATTRLEWQRRRSNGKKAG